MAGICPRCGFESVEGGTCPRCGVDVAGYRARVAIAAGPPGPVARVFPPAGFWIRVVAALIDGVVLLIAQWMLSLIAFIAFGHAGSARSVSAAAQVMSVILGFVYPIIFHWQWGQTLGKMAMHIRVVALNGGPLTLGQATLRQFGAWLSAILLGIGYLMVAFRADKRGLHDLIAGTRVERLT